MNEHPDDDAGAPWHQRLWRRTSLPTQVLHSSTSFLMMAGMARFAPTEAFALAAAFFLLVTLTSSLNVYVLSAAWLRHGDSADIRPLAAFTLLISAVLALLLTGAWAVYRHWAFGPAPRWEIAQAGLAAFSYLYCLAWRRQLLLDARFHLASFGDGLRAVLILGGGLFMHSGKVDLSFDSFLLIFVFGHLVAVAPVLRELLGRGGGQPTAHRGWRFALQPLAAITRGDWLSVASGLANVVFSQAASLIAPMLIGAHQYATLRAYELFLFPVIFMAQVLDPIYMRRFRGIEEASSVAQPYSAARPLRDMMLPALLMFAPLAVGLAIAALVPPLRDLLMGLVAPEYRADAWLFFWVLALSACIALNAPMRWRLMVAGAGAPLLRGTAVGIVASLTLLWLFTLSTPLAWTVLAAKIAYELCLFGASVAGLWALGRQPRPS